MLVDNLVGGRKRFEKVVEVRVVWEEGEFENTLFI